MRDWHFAIGNARVKQRYGACKSAAFSAFLKVDKRQSSFFSPPLHPHARRRSPTLLLCFLQSCVSWYIGGGQELTFPATVAISGNVSSRHLFSHVKWINFLEKKVCGLYDFIWFHVRLMTSVRATGFRDRLDPCGIFFVNCQLLWLTGSTRHLGHSCLITVDQACAPSAKIVSGCITNVLQVNWRRCCNVSGTFGKYWQITYRKCHNASGTSCKWFDEDVTMYQDRLASYLQKMSQRVGNV